MRRRPQTESARVRTCGSSYSELLSRQWRADPGVCEAPVVYVKILQPEVDCMLFASQMGACEMH